MMFCPDGVWRKKMSLSINGIHVHKSECIENNIEYPESTWGVTSCEAWDKDGK